MGCVYLYQGQQFKTKEALVSISYLDENKNIRFVPFGKAFNFITKNVDKSELILLYYLILSINILTQSKNST